MELIINSNTCVGAEIYQRLRLQYASPLIGTLIPNDLEYLEYVKKFKQLINSDIQCNLIPKDNTVFERQSCSKYYQHAHISTPYPIIHMGTTDIHCIHDTGSDATRVKFMRRIDRMKNIMKTESYKIVNVMVFTEFLNIHENYEDIIKTFLSNIADDTINIFLGPEKYKIPVDTIKNAYIPVKEWDDISLDRDGSFVMNHNNQDVSRDLLSQFILKLF